jgi:hypothetical protein
MYHRLGTKSGGCIGSTSIFSKMEKRMVEMKQTAKGARKTTAVNEKTEWESLYQNCCNTHQTDGRTILYNLYEEENESRIGTKTCTLVTISESKEREKGNNDSESSLSEIETEAGMEAEVVVVVVTVTMGMTGTAETVITAMEAAETALTGR